MAKKPGGKVTSQLQSPWVKGAATKTDIAQLFEPSNAEARGAITSELATATILVAWNGTCGAQGCAFVLYETDQIYSVSVLYDRAQGLAGTFFSRCEAMTITDLRAAVADGHVRDVGSRLTSVQYSGPEGEADAWAALVELVRLNTPIV